MKKNKAKAKTLMFLSAGFVCLMLTMTMVLFVGSSEDPIYVDGQNAQINQSYDLEEIDITDVEMPVSMLGKNWNIPQDSDVPVELSLNQFADQAVDAQVPEPATAALIIAGGIGMFARYRRKRG